MFSPSLFLSAMLYATQSLAIVIRQSTSDNTTAVASSSTAKNATVPITLNITDTAGNDISDKLTIIYPATSQSLNQTTHSKRGGCMSSSGGGGGGGGRGGGRGSSSYTPITQAPIGRPIIECLNTGGRLIHSECVPEISPRTWRIQCTPGGERYLFGGVCSRNEVCVDIANNPFSSEPIAYCIQVESDLVIQKHTQSTGFPQGSKLPLAAPAAAGDDSCANPDGEQPQLSIPLDGVNEAVGVLLTTDDGNSVVNANFLQIQAETTKELFGAVSNTVMPGGIASCQDCSSVVLQPIPKGVQNLAARFILPIGVSATLYWPYVIP